MKVLAILGPLGSGKTTQVNKILAEFSELRTLVVVNDVGTENVDARRIKSAGDIKALTAGCIGCSDLPAFRAVIEEAKGIKDLDLLLIEPTGIADGREVRDAVTGTGCEFRALTLVDVQHFERNRALGCMEGQLEVATTVALSWSNGETPMEVLEFIGKHAPGRSIVAGLSDVRAVVSDTLAMTAGTHTHSASCGCKHQHEHAHNHGVYSFSLSLTEDTSYGELVSALAPHLNSLVRSKGVVSGRTFDFVQGDIRLGEMDTSAPYGNFIFNRKVGEEVFASIAKELREDTRSKKDRMREADVPLSSTLAAIAWQLEQYPPVVTPGGDLRVDCEADVVYQLAKRKDVPADLRQAVMRKYVSWRLEAAHRLLAGDWAENTSLPYWKRRLGLNLAYMCAVYPELVGDNLVEQVTQVCPAEMLAEGLLGLTSLSFDEEMAEEKPETVAKALGLATDTSLAESAVRHCVNLAKKTPEWLSRWTAVL